MSTFEAYRPLDGGNFRGISRAIILISGALLVLQLFIGGFLSDWLALTPAAITERYRLWQFVTYAFLHSGFFHWLFNMFIFWVFGAAMERQWGTGYFVRFLLITTIGSGACVYLLDPHSTQPLMGSSGAVFGLLVAFALLFPQAVIHMYFLIPLKAWQAAILFGVIELFAAWHGGAGGMRAIGHLAGMGFAYVYIRWGTTIDGFFTRWPLPHIRLQKRSAPRLEEVTDELVGEVDRILDKVSKEGADSLSPKEKSILDRYTKTRR